jgi:hypothetical protein
MTAGYMKSLVVALGVMAAAVYIAQSSADGEFSPFR